MLECDQRQSKRRGEWEAGCGEPNGGPCSPVSLFAVFAERFASSIPSRRRALAPSPFTGEGWGGGNGTCASRRTRAAQSHEASQLHGVPSLCRRIPATRVLSSGRRYSRGRSVVRGSAVEWPTSPIRGKALRCDQNGVCEGRRVAKPNRCLSLIAPVLDRCGSLESLSCIASLDRLPTQRAAADCLPAALHGNLDPPTTHAEQA